MREENDDPNVATMLRHVPGDTIHPGSVLPDNGSRVETLMVPCEIYSRVVGYLRPIQNWHAGKQQEYLERLEFTFPELADDPQPLDNPAVKSAV